MCSPSLIEIYSCFKIILHCTFSVQRVVICVNTQQLLYLNVNCKKLLVFNLKKINYEIKIPYPGFFGFFVNI